MENSLSSNSRTKDYGKNKIIAASLFTLETAKSPGAIYGPFSDAEEAVKFRSHWALSDNVSISDAKLGGGEILLRNG